jgi:hypothetical protein
VALQQQVAELQNVKFYDQFDLPIMTLQTKDKYYLSDNLHMNYNGYANVGLYQLYFLATEKIIKTKK